MPLNLFVCADDMLRHVEVQSIGFAVVGAFPESDGPICFESLPYPYLRKYRLSFAASLAGVSN